MLDITSLNNDIKITDRKLARTNLNLLEELTWLKRSTIGNQFRKLDLCIQDYADVVKYIRRFIRYED